jgi:predicted nucleic acid-binding protein
MAASVLVDAGFLVALLNRRDANHGWAAAQAPRFPPPWKSCDAALTEAFHVITEHRRAVLYALLQRRLVVCTFHMGEDIDEILALMKKYAGVPMSFADACLVRMTEALPDPILLTTDTDFHVYRRHGRQFIPCLLPGQR